MGANGAPAEAPTEELSEEEMLANQRLQPGEAVQQMELIAKLIVLSMLRIGGLNYCLPRHMLPAACRHSVRRECIRSCRQNQNWTCLDGTCVWMKSASCADSL